MQQSDFDPDKAFSSFYQISICQSKRPKVEIVHPRPNIAGIVNHARGRCYKCNMFKKLGLPIFLDSNASRLRCSEGATIVVDIHVVAMPPTIDLVKGISIFGGMMKVGFNGYIAQTIICLCHFGVGYIIDRSWRSRLRRCGLEGSIILLSCGLLVVVAAGCEMQFTEKGRIRATTYRSAKRSSSISSGSAILATASLIYYVC
jgi:hypothetical protein